MQFVHVRHVGDDFLLLYLAENYQPVHAKWTTERCAICRWVEDWDYNKIIICNRFMDLQFQLSCSHNSSRSSSILILEICVV